MSNTTSYDEVPYPSGAYQQAHPDRLEALATFFGMSPADIRSCRVLELGAADGSNLLPMACAYPGSHFVGVDLSITHISSGRRTIDALGLSNIELHHADILDVDDGFGRFDYVIVHGVYSWVPPHVQDRILELCSRCLSSQGVAYISYNTNPGWRMRGLLRDMMLYHTRKFEDPGERVAQARALVAWLADTVDADGNPYGMLLKRELEQMQTWHDAYFRHDSLGEINEPLYFHEFVTRAERHQLQYLAEADITAMIASNYTAPVDAALDRLSRDIIEIEQYMDFLRNRMFRQTLLCHRGIRLDRALGPWNVEAFHIAASLRLDGDALDLAPGVTVTFRGARNLTISSGHPLVKAAMACLAEAWPAQMPFRELLARARARLGDDADRDHGGGSDDAEVRVVAGALLTSFVRGLCELHVHAATFEPLAGERPCACPLVRLQATTGDFVTNRRHERVFLDALAQHLLPLLDGCLDRAALVEVLVEPVLAGSLVLDSAASVPRDAAQAREMLAPAVDAALSTFGRMALLVHPAA